MLKLGIEWNDLYCWYCWTKTTPIYGNLNCMEISKFIRLAFGLNCDTDSPLSKRRSNTNIWYKSKWTAWFITEWISCNRIKSDTINNINLGSTLLVQTSYQKVILFYRKNGLTYSIQEKTTCRRRQTLALLHEAIYKPACN